MAGVPSLLSLLSHELRGPLLTFSHLAPALQDALLAWPRAQALAGEAARQAQAFHEALGPTLQADIPPPPAQRERWLLDARARLSSLQSLTRQAQAACASGPEGPERQQARRWLRQLAEQWRGLQALLDMGLPDAWSALSPPSAPAPVDVAQRLRDLHDFMAPQARARGLSWTLDLGPMPSLLWTHDQALRQVLMNLLGNALKYTPSGGVRLRARWEEARTDRAPARGHLVLEVIDTGLGMDEAQQAAACEPGVRWHPEQSEGHGLGLAVVQAWTERLGVGLTWQSAPGQGTTVRLEWPMQTAQALKDGRSCPD